MASTPPHRLESERLVIRCWQPTDAPLLEEAIASSLDHLKPWMPWIARELLARRDRVEYLRSMRASFDRDEEPLGKRSVRERSVSHAVTAAHARWAVVKDRHTREALLALTQFPGIAWGCVATAAAVAAAIELILIRLERG
jgi:hypothetical protein